MKPTTRARLVALFATFAIIGAACGGADAPPEATDTGVDTATSDDGATAPDSSTEEATSSAPETTSATESSGAGGSSGVAGYPEGADTILTAAPTTEADSAVFAVYRETATIDPLFVFDYPDNSAMAIACESLLRQDPDMSIAPGLATSVEYTSDTSLVITLREGVTFWDGTPLTVDDVVFSLERQRNPENGGFYSQVFSNVTAIEVTGDLEVTLTTTGQDTLLYGELAGPVGAIISKAFVEAAEPGTFGTAGGGVMCTGPYQLTDWTIGEGLTFTRYDGYWDTGLPLLLREVTIIGVPDEAALTSGLLTGEIDGVYSLILSTLDQLRESDQVNVTEGPTLGISAFIVSSFEGALGDKGARQALSMAIDRQGLVDSLHKGAGFPARAIAQPGTWGYSQELFTEAWNALPDVSVPNLEEAQRLVDEAGVAGQTIKIGMSSEIPAILVQAGEFQRAAESIGLEVELVSKSAAEYINFFIDPAAFTSVDGFFTVNYPDYADPLALYSTIVGPDGSQAYNGYADPVAADLIARARVEPDDDARAELVIELQEILTDETLWIPIVAPTQVLVLNKDLTGAPSTFSYMFGPWAAYIGAP